MRQAVHHLVDHGHRRIGFITGPQQTSTGLERYQAYRQLLAEHGLEVDEDLVVEGDFQEESGRMGARRLLDGGATAILRPTPSCRWGRCGHALTRGSHR